MAKDTAKRSRGKATGVVVPLRPPPGHPRKAIEELLVLTGTLRACLGEAEEVAKQAHAILPETWSCHPPEPTVDELDPYFYREPEPLAGERLLAAEQRCARDALRRVTAKLQRWSADWQGLKDNNEHEARMRFTSLVEQRAIVVRDMPAGATAALKRKILFKHAEDIIGRVQHFFPGARVDAAHLARAIEVKAESGRWAWASLVKAWVRPGVEGSAETWRQSWAKWSNEKQP